MAVDSVFGGDGGGGAQVPVPLSNAALALLNHFLTDTLGSSLTNGNIDGTPTVWGTGQNGEIQGGVAPGLGTIDGTIVNGELHLDISLPGITGIVFEGMDSVSPEEWGAYLKSVVEGYAPNSGQGIALNLAIDHLVAQILDQGVTSMVVRVFDLLTGAQVGASSPLADGANDIVIDASANLGVEIFAINLAQATANQTVVFKGVEAAILSGNGSVRVDGSTAINLIGDTGAQNITGGEGSDTLVGGGGADTLTGGLSDDTFGFTSLVGRQTITDFDTAHDQVAFDLAGVTTLAQLGAMVTRIDEFADGVTYNFGNDGSITLIGVTAAELTADMIKLSI